MILGKPFLRRADGADDFRAQILFAADPVVEFFRERIVEKPVDGEIAALRVGLGIAENDFLRTPAILIIRLGAKGGDLELMFAFDDNHHAEFACRRRMVFLKSFSICSGRASVAMSKSCGSRPSRKSRTQPPTQNAAKPAACRRRTISTAVRAMECQRGGHLRFTIYDLRANGASQTQPLRNCANCAS